MRVSDDKAVIVTVDFFPAIVDDPYMFGQVAAANAMSDVYAMGGDPLCALNIAAFPEGKLPIEVLAELLRGGADKVNEAGAVIVGGHTLKGAELKYGLSVTGIIHPEMIIRTEGARPGDFLALTKPLGTGIYSTVMKEGGLPEDLDKMAVEVMAVLNRDGAELMRKHNASACTDITGFGLAGHALEMAEASGATLAFDLDSIPLLPGLEDFAERGFLTGGGMENLRSVESSMELRSDVSEAMKMILCDPQTSGGLLVSLPGAETGGFVDEMKRRGHLDTSVVGEVLPGSGRGIIFR